MKGGVAFPYLWSNLRLNQRSKNKTTGKVIQGKSNRNKKSPNSFLDKFILNFC